MSIKIEELTYIYNKGLPDEQKALDNVTFDLEDNRIMGVIGHTGSGKSTLVQHLNGLIKATSGKIFVDDMEVTDPKTNLIDVRRNVGLVFQYPEYQLFEETVEKDVAFGPKNLGLDEEEIKKRVEEALFLVGLDYDFIKERSPFELSGGQKRRVAIAGVIAMKPKVLILDEPTAGLDPSAHEEVLKMIKNIHEKQKNIIIFVSHNMDDIARLSDKVLVLDKGKVFLFGTPREVFSKRDRLLKVGLEVPFASDLAKSILENLPKESQTSFFEKEILTMGELEQSLYGFLTGGTKND